ncbi:MAG: YceI family protein [Candidatus Marinimicrobia bacterium]|nr:YceI family protein [Candidatus Neomarinimicrobiota bacterium]MCF7921141.1 YceI family protein [Candidatus Neomarinimicrobiota bacterium]
MVAQPIKANTPIDVNKSSVEWLAKKVTGQHNGSLMLKEASVDIQKQTLVGGRFVFDMSTIKVLDIEEGKWNTKLLDHLKSDDFFSVDKFPLAVFEISSATALKNPKPGAANYDIKGDLTIKGITHAVSFQARVDIQANQSMASGEIIVDRTLYDIRYRSGKFFEELGDKTIYDDFTISFDVITK